MKNNKVLVPPTQDDIQALKIVTRERLAYQQRRKAMDNRLGVKKDGTDQDLVEPRHFRADDLADFKEMSAVFLAQEKILQKKMAKILKRFPIWTEWIKPHVKGCAEISAGVMLSSFDIHIATTVSKLWQYAGLNPSDVPGKKRIKTDDPANYVPRNGVVVKRGDGSERGKYVIVKTNTMIPGDRLTEGFVAPYNSDLRVALCGVMADCMIKCKSSYAIDYYYPRKERLKQSDKQTTERRKGGEVETIAWKDARDGHHDRAAKRYMVKMFLKDLYNHWRAIEGLEVRPDYQEQYLGHKHNTITIDLASPTETPMRPKRDERIETPVVLNRAKEVETT